METTVKKREWVKNAAIILLAVLLVLTFFSNTIMNRSLPEVATTAIRSGTITAQIRGTGTVSASQSYEVKIDQTRKVKAVMIREGQEVSAGDLLFVLSVDSEELEAAEEQLRQLRLSYQQKLLSASGSEAARANTEIQRAREDLADAEAARDALNMSEAAAATLRDTINKATAEAIPAQATVDQYKRELDAAEYGVNHTSDAISSGGSGASSDQIQRLNAAKSELTAAQNSLFAIQNTADFKTLKAEAEAKTANSRELEYYMQEIADEDKKNTPPDAAGKISALEEQISSLTTKLVTLEEEISALTQTISGFQQAIDNLPAGTSSDDPQLQSYQKNLVSSNSELVEKKSAQTAAESSLANARKELDSLQDTVSTSSPKYAIHTKYLAAQTAVEDAQAKVASAQAIVVSANSSGTYTPGTNYNGHNHQYYVKEYGRIEELLHQAQLSLDAINNRKDDAQTRLDAYTAARDKVRSCERSLEDLLLSQQDLNRSAQLNSLELQDLNGQIERQQAKVDELGEDASGNEITADVGGIIGSISITAGSSTVPGSAMATIDVPDMGYLVSFSVTADQARRVHAGDNASAANVYWGSQIDATLTGIRTDPKDPQNSKILTFEVNGDVTPGSSLTLTVGQRGAEYDYIVPRSAVRPDSTNGDYVLVITAKNSPLGDRYIATRVPVEVIARDDVNAAVTGALEQGDFVITTSSAPIDNGKRVRLADSQ